MLILQLSFVGTKIAHQLAEARLLDAADLGLQNSRFASAMLDFTYMRESPVLGNGLHELTRYRYHSSYMIGGHGNGLTDFIAKFGALGFLTFIWCAYRGFLVTGQQGPARSALIIVAVMLTLTGEQMLNHPMFLCFMFLDIPERASASVGSPRQSQVLRTISSPQVPTRHSATAPTTLG
jgi:hypothetical protein